MPMLTEKGRNKVKIHVTMRHFFWKSRCKIIVYQKIRQDWRGGKNMDENKEKMEVETDELDREFVAEPSADEEFISDGSVLIREEIADDIAPKAMRKGEVKEILSKIFAGVLWVLVAFLLGSAELPFGAIPFGIALLCAASSKVGYIYLGLVLSAMGAEGAIVYFCAYTATLFIRALGRIIVDNPFDNEDEDSTLTLSDVFPLLFSEHVFLRMASACIGAFIIGIYTLVAGGFLYYDLIGVIIGMVASPVAVYLYCGLAGNGGALGLDKSVFRAYVTEARKFAALSTLFASLILATREYSPFGMSVSLFGAMVVTLYFCRKDGIMYGLVAGTLCGLAYSPVLAPMFVFAAIASGALFKVSTFFACLSACTVSVAWGLYCEGVSALSTVLPTALAACLIFAVAEKMFLSDIFDSCGGSSQSAYHGGYPFPQVKAEAFGIDDSAFGKRMSFRLYNSDKQLCGEL